MFLEVVYETGRMSVMEVATEEEGKDALRNHDQRARNGESGGPLGQPAERIAAVYMYDVHPNDYNDDQTMSADVAEKEIAALIKEAKDENGVVSLDQLALGVRGLTHPMNEKVDLSGFASRYRIKETKKLDLAFLEGGAK